MLLNVPGGGLNTHNKQAHTKGHHLVLMEQGNKQSNKKATQDSKKIRKEHVKQREASKPNHKAHPQDHQPRTP